MRRTTRRLGLTAAGSGLAAVALWFGLQQPTVEVDALDKLGPGYQIVEVSELECGQGERSICSRTFSIRHETSRDDLRRKLAGIGITPEENDDLLPDAGAVPGRSEVVLAVVAEDPSLVGLFAFVLLSLTFVVATVGLAAVAVVRSIRRVFHRAS